MELTAEQKKAKCLIEKVWSAIGMYSPWPVAVAMTKVIGSTKNHPGKRCFSDDINSNERPIA